MAANSNVQDAFVIAVEKQARERLERLSALKKIKPVDMTKLSQQVLTVCFGYPIYWIYLFCINDILVNLAPKKYYLG